MFITHYNTTYNDSVKYNTIKKSRQNERYRLPLHVNYYKWKKDIRQYLPLFAGIGVEKLYLFYTHVLYILDFHSLSNDICQNGRYNQIWDDILMMVKDPLFSRKLRQLERFKEEDFLKIHNILCGATIAIIEEGQTIFGFDRKQVLYFLVDIAINALQNYPKYNDRLDGYDRARIIDDNSEPFRKVLQYQIYRGSFPVEDRLLALKTLYTRKVKIPACLNANAKSDDANDTNKNETNIGSESFLYELNFEKLLEHENIAFHNKRFKEQVMDKLERVMTEDKETQTETQTQTEDQTEKRII